MTAFVGIVVAGGWALWCARWTDRPWVWAAVGGGVVGLACLAAEVGR